MCLHENIFNMLYVEPFEIYLMIVEYSITAFEVM
jgi:hypothetical protein